MNMNAEAVVGSQVRGRREALGLTRKELAHRVGCSIETVRKIESGERHPSRQIADLLAQVLSLDGQTASAPPTNLPAPLTSFIGRASELATLQNWLREKDARARLLTLTGPPGVGKTRLSIEAALAGRDAFPDGVFFVELAPISSAELVPSAIAQALGVREAPGRTLLESIGIFLRDQRALLVLDNFEHVTHAALAVITILSSAPHVKVIATSREALRVRGERIFAVEPLGLPSSPGSKSAGSLMAFSGVALFVERAREVQTDFALTHNNAEAVAELCTRLDGLPLAIELAASRINIVSPQRMLAQRFDGASPDLTLTGEGPRDLPLRQQTLHNEIEWSYWLLEPEQQRVFRGLGVFSGGFSLQAVNEILNDGRDGEAILASLVQKNLVRLSREADGEPRFSLLETIREYALQQATTLGELERIRQKHADHFLEFTEAVWPKLYCSEMISWLDLLDLEHPNLRLTLDWYHSLNDSRSLLRLATLLSRFWYQRGHFSEGRKWLGIGLNLPSDDPRLRAHALCAASSLAWRMSDHEEAMILAQDGLQLFQESSDVCGIALALGTLGLVWFLRGDLVSARQLLSDGIAQVPNLVQMPQLLAFALGTLANIEISRGGNDAARQVAEYGLQLHRDKGELSQQAWCLYILGWLVMSDGDFQRATHLHAEGLTIARALDDKSVIGAILCQLGEIRRYQGDAEGAEVFYSEALEHFQRIGDRSDASWAWLCLGNSALLAGRLSEALTRVKASVRLRRETHTYRGVANVWLSLARIRVDLGQIESAARWLGTTQAALRQVGQRFNNLEQAEYNAATTAVRLRLDAQTFAQAWAQGEAMTHEQAIATALAAE